MVERMTNMAVGVAVVVVGAAVMVLIEMGIAMVDATRMLGIVEGQGTIDTTVTVPVHMSAVDQGSPNT